MNDHAMTWLLVNKIRFERSTSYGDLTATVRRAAQSMVHWKGCNSEPNLREEEYWNTACAVVVAFRGKNWVQKQLKGSSNGSAGQSSRLTRCPTHHNDLPVATFHGDRSIVETLLKEGADVNAIDEYLGDALYAAAYRGNTDIVGILLEYGADIDKRWNTQLLAAADKGYVEVVQLLLDKGANINGGGGTNCLLAACRNGHEHVVRLLLTRYDIDVNVKNPIGQTPLLVAAQNKHWAVMRPLLERDQC
jgi:ankyrin repeat protein